MTFYGVVRFSTFSSQLVLLWPVVQGQVHEMHEPVFRLCPGRPVFCPRQYRRVALSHHPDKGGSKQAFVRLQGAKASWRCKIAREMTDDYGYYQPTTARNTENRSGIKKQTSY